MITTSLVTCSRGLLLSIARFPPNGDLEGDRAFLGGGEGERGRPPAPLRGGGSLGEGAAELSNCCRLRGHPVPGCCRHAEVASGCCAVVASDCCVEEASGCSAEVGSESSSALLLLHEHHEVASGRTCVSAAEESALLWAAALGHKSETGSPSSAFEWRLDPEPNAQQA
eukprot:CAMPEP_0183547496 /NCGR_PEP_ID=MMETSP0371-20130417/57389_1 /TAXON_ID=268820 /ORGANISM="Peridinium aciculiferum, Strain PAER-2" /LENGTH=168 /DNA_ID=CAMNT_0025750457 /DNA_START=335 /DNA_END=843 /DNA_ORIENTATION=-